jgi:hypothetical protein
MSLLTLVVTLSHAQIKLTLGNVKYDFGLKEGLNIPYIHNSAGWTNEGDRTGFHFGGYATIKTGRLAIQPEILYSRQIHTYSFPGLSQNNSPITHLNFATNFDYVNLPIIFKYYLSDRLNIQAGPQFSWLANGSNQITTWDFYLVQPISRKISDFVKSSDFALAVGAGWDLPCGLNFTARYNIGLIDMNKSPSPSGDYIESSFATREAKNHVLQLSVGFHLAKLGK